MNRAFLPIDGMTVTALPLASGSVWVAGSVGIELNARPIIGLVLPYAPFRDLTPGAVGSDVREVQQGLRDLGYLTSEQVDGEYGPTTSAAVHKLYRDLGYQPQLTQPDALTVLDQARERTARARATYASAATPESESELIQARDELEDLVGSVGVILPRDEVAALSGELVVLDLADLHVGSRTALPGPPWLTGGPRSLDCQESQALGQIGEQLLDHTAIDGLGEADIVQADVSCVIGLDALRQAFATQLSLGQKALGAAPADSLEASGLQGQGAVVVKVALPGDCDLDLGLADLQLVSHLSQEPSLVVPATALWQGPDGDTYVRLLQDQTSVDVRVEVLGSLDGEAAIAGGDLQVGDHVLIGADR